MKQSEFTAAVTEIDDRYLMEAAEVKTKKICAGN